MRKHVEGDQQPNSAQSYVPFRRSAVGNGASTGQTSGSASKCADHCNRRSRRRRGSLRARSGISSTCRGIGRVAGTCEEECPGDRISQLHGIRKCGDIEVVSWSRGVDEGACSRVECSRLGVDEDYISKLLVLATCIE